MSKKVLAALTLSLVASTFSFADEEITVSGVRLDQAETEVGSSVSILTADEIENLGVDYVLDAVATLPGITTNQNGAFGGSASVRIRGASSEQTLVIVDGVSSNDPSSPGGGFDFARLDPSNIERIEVLKGPQSTLWGTDAIGGVVNIVTKRPQERLQGNAFAQAGSFSSFRGGAQISGAGDVFHYRLSASTHTTDGISKADEANGNTQADSFDSTTVNASVGADIFGAANVRLTLLWTDAENEFDSFAFGAQGNVADGDELSATEELVGNVEFNLPLFDGTFNNTLLLGYNDIERNNFTNGIAGFQSTGDRLTYRYLGDVTINDQQRVAFGVEREENTANGESNAIDGLFALYELLPTDTLTLTAGIRQDDHQDFGSQTTARFAAAYNPTDLVTLRMSWGEGFKAPTLFQTTFFCCGASAPNPNLKPETAEAFDIGITLRTADARGEVGLTYFDQDTSNLITFSFAIGGYENIAEARSTGLEFVANYKLLDWLETSLSYTNIDAKDGTGAELIRVPEHTANLRFTIKPEGKWSGSVLLTYNGDEEDFNGNVPSWTRTDITAQYALSESLQLYARAENIFDRQYQQIIGYGTPGRSGFLGARLRF